MTDIGRERRLLASQGLRITYREHWGAVQHYNSARTVYEPVKWFFLHISVTQDPNDLIGYEDDSMRAIERVGQQRFGIGFPYNAAAFDTGRLYEGQPLTRRGAHTVNNKGNPTFGNHDLNRWTRALVLPQMVGDTVTDGQIDAAARWAAAQIRSGMAATSASWYGHRDVAWKDCPGQRGYDRIRQLNQLTGHYARFGLGTTPGGLGMASEEFGQVMSKLNRIDALANGNRFILELLWDMLTPNGFAYVKKGTIDRVPAGTPGAVPVLDIHRWMQETTDLSRDEEDRGEALVELVEQLKQLREEPAPEPEDEATEAPR